MNATLRAALAPLKEKATGAAIFARPDGSPDRSIRTAFKTACRRARLGGVSPHVLRLRLRAVRLRALAEAPMAFGSTLAREQTFPESAWHERAASGASGPDRATFIAEAAGRWVGMATGVGRHPEGPDHSPMLIGMFVDSTQRGRGVGTALVERVTEWARTVAAQALYLWAASTNRSAITLYEKCGFRQTEEARPLEHTPSLREVLMERSLR